MASAVSGAGDSIDADRQAWDTLLQKGEVLDHFSNDHDTDINVEEVSNRIDGSKMQKLIKDRYNKVTSLYLDDEGWCIRYAYFTEGTGIPPIDKHNSVKHIHDSSTMQRRQPVVDTTMMLQWQELDDLTKDKLYIVLYAANSIWKRIHFNTDLEGWVHRLSEPQARDVHSSLAGYGMSGKDERSMLDILYNGRSKEDMKKSIQDIKKSFICNQHLDDVWVLALTSGMRNGSGRAAVYMLLDMISSLLPGLGKSFPEIAVTHVTSPSGDDAFSITSSSHSKPTTRSKSGSPAAKRRRIIKESDSDSDDEVSPKSKAVRQGETKKKKKNRITWPKRNRKFVDLRVFSLDVSSGVTKYLVVVEILSRGKTLLQAQKKFTKELVHVLQAQNMVYGLFFTETTILLYNATRDSATQKVQISYDTYVLLEGPRKKYGENDHESFRVAQFQRLIMDIFTCILHGMQYIDA